MRRYLIIVLAFSLFLLATGVKRTRADDASERAVVAKKFVDGYFRTDYEVMKACVPVSFKDMTGPFPYASQPTIIAIKVDENQALAEFTVKVTESKIPTRGAVLFYKKSGLWYVRQVMYFNKIPKVFGLPTKSKTAADKSFEAVVHETAIKFFKLWEEKKFDEMELSWFRWPDMDREPIDKLSVRNIKITQDETSWKDPYINFSCQIAYKLTSWLPPATMQVKGHFMMVKVGDTWKVRGNQIMLEFP
ncbi:MAG: hypothetical protein WCO98_07095 [bacterium]